MKSSVNMFLDIYKALQQKNIYKADIHFSINKLKNSIGQSSKGLAARAQMVNV